MSEDITAHLLLNAYANGVFPMSESRDDPELFWVDPRMRGVLPLDDFHISKSLRKHIRRGGFDVTLNGDFEGVLEGCADRDDTWINDTIRRLYCELHEAGFAHSIEVIADGVLIGGAYGVSLGGAFFGESMFSRQVNASKVALTYLTAHLTRCGFTLLDTQFITDHLASLGAVEIPRAQYHRQLQAALDTDADFLAYSDAPDTGSVLQRSTQTS
ncbi:leucyl/phenylalanyl-tRNA--protein transferase [Halocynthiibacter styelae]|uniref:Leucyl/phenylalanyl-tRNA--protein transferase n=1 Tax=Halocynthiibacter styelae TaxID=2761955 RepID=A0A8J7IWI5_9RHOB|nr:leucyl/phenylalanyl-tRNA--protein transferase [Paenihalocynthiibacter styelae]MBI1493135.1 leucyl/phenylalanyl-tRNA--protein transferase [Paenihalocynthiibacter styelae]